MTDSKQELKNHKFDTSEYIVTPSRKPQVTKEQIVEVLDKYYPQEKCLGGSLDEQIQSCTAEQILKLFKESDAKT